MTRRRSSRPLAPWPAVALAVAVCASTALTAHTIVDRGRRRRPSAPLAPRRLEAPPGAHRPGDG